MQTKQHFRDYMEDYNTNTLPHEKYIDLEKWEMAEFHREYYALFCFLASWEMDRSIINVTSDDVWYSSELAH